MNYYNEHNPDAAAWLRKLIAMGEIPNGIVDDRSILDVRPTDLVGFTQCHFFAGIGGWAYALKLAGWPDDRQIWTGSCPCQSFSVAGKGAGFADERHLWPAWFPLIEQCRPSVVVGEQVAAAIRHGWLDLVFDDLEGLGYTCGAACLPAGALAPHKRDRLWFVAHSDPAGCVRQRSGELLNGQRQAQRDDIDGCCDVCDMGDAPSRGFGIDRSAQGQGGHADQPEPTFAMAHSRREGLAGWPIEHARPELSPAERSGAAWRDIEWIWCRDGKYRPIEPGIFPLADGLPKSLVRGGDQRLAPDSTAEARRMRLKGYGNAIVPQIGAAIIRAWEMGVIE